MTSRGPGLALATCIAAAALGCGGDDSAHKVPAVAQKASGDAGGRGAPVASSASGIGASGSKPALASKWMSCGAAWDDQDGGVSPDQDVCALDERFGVFVDAAKANASTFDGSRDYPFGSLQDAIVVAVNAHKQVYACAGVYEERVKIGTAISNGLTLYGGLSCKTFLPDPMGGRTIVRAKGKGAALTIADAHGISIEHVDFENVADRAAGNPAKGTSYVAAYIDTARQVVLRDVGLLADEGEAGLDGAPPSTTPAPSGVAGLDGANACAAYPNPGAGPVSNLGCTGPAAGQATGMQGGDGAIATVNGGAAGNGFPVGESLAATWSCAVGVGVGYPPPGMPYMLAPDLTS